MERDIHLFVVNRCAIVPMVCIPTSSSNKVVPSWRQNEHYVLYSQGMVSEVGSQSSLDRDVVLSMPNTILSFSSGLPSLFGLDL